MNGRGELFGDGGPGVSRLSSAWFLGSLLAYDTRPVRTVYYERNEKLASVIVAAAASLDKQRVVLDSRWHRCSEMISELSLVNIRPFTLQICHILLG